MLLVLNLGEEDAARLHEVEEKYRTGPLAGKAQHGRHGGLRQDRSGAGRTPAATMRANILPVMA